MARKARFVATQEAAVRAPYDEYPMLPPGVDPQLHLSRNDRTQPFFLICEHDTVLVTVTGTGKVEFVEGPVRYHTMKPGDFIYVPSGMPHRIVPAMESVHLRYKAEHPGLEAVAWYCEHCGAELTREIWDTAEELAQEGYLRATKAFNADARRRTCARCGEVHPVIDLAPYKWQEVAGEIRADLAEATKKAAARKPPPA